MLKQRGSFENQESYCTLPIGRCDECGEEVDLDDDHEEVGGKLHHTNCLPICEACNEIVYDAHPDGLEMVDRGPICGTFECITFRGERTIHDRRDMTFAGYYHRNHFIDAFFPPEEGA